MEQAIRAGERAGARYTLAAPRTAPTGQAGMQLGRRAGQSLEFQDYRDYQPGDDLRSIDWSAYARSDRLTVKLYREEVTPHLDVLLDGSRSMALADSAKPEAAVGLAAAFCAAAGNGGFTHAVHRAGDGCEPIPGGQGSPATWGAVSFDAETGLDAALARMPPRWRRMGLRVLISDLLFMGDPLRVLEPIAHGAAGVHVVQLLARADADPPAHGNVRLVDAESRAVQEVFIDAAARKRYQANLARHQQQWHAGCRKVGALMTTLIAEDLTATWNLSSLGEAGMLVI